MVVGASRGESLNITCKVEADPPAHNFRWKFNNSGETLEVAQGRFSMETSSGVSVFRYTPTTELDYGTLSCWADNSVGRQARPCLFQLIAAGKYLPDLGKRYTNLESSSSGQEIELKSGNEPLYTTNYLENISRPLSLSLEKRSRLFRIDRCMIEICFFFFFEFQEGRKGTTTTTRGGKETDPRELFEGRRILGEQNRRDY